MYVSECVRETADKRATALRFLSASSQKFQVNAMWGSHSPYAVLPQWRLELLDATEKTVDLGLCFFL